jgi:hypothetical protein
MQHVKAEIHSSPASEPQKSPRVRERMGWVAGISALVVALGVVGVLLYGYLAKPGWVGVSDKKLWDYLELLIVPAALAIGVAWLNWAQRTRERKAEESQKERQLEIEDQRAQDVALQALLDQLTLLLLEKQGDKLVRMKADGDVRKVVQARAEPLLRSLNATRRWSLVLFLAVVGLLAKDRPIISLAGADLRGVDGRGAPLEGVDLAGANLTEAQLESANLRSANLFEANLREANLFEAKLDRANLAGCNLEKATLFGADLGYANLQGTNLRNAILAQTDLRNANLQGADLEGADFWDALLEGAKMPDNWEPDYYGY